MRWLGFLVFLAGLALSFGAAAIFQTATSREIARALIYENGSFKPFEIDLGPSQAPLGLKIIMREGGQYSPALGEAALTLTATHQGRSAFAGAVVFSEANRLNSPATGAAEYTKNISKITDLSSGSYVFSAGEGDAENIALQSVELVLLANAFETIPDVSTYGTILIWLGAGLFVIGLRRRNRAAENQPPAPSKWGRGG